MSDILNCKLCGGYPSDYELHHYPNGKDLPVMISCCQVTVNGFGCKDIWNELMQTDNECKCGGNCGGNKHMGNTLDSILDTIDETYHDYCPRCSENLITEDESICAGCEGAAMSDGMDAPDGMQPMHTTHTADTQATHGDDNTVCDSSRMYTKDGKLTLEVDNPSFIDGVDLLGVSTIPKQPTSYATIYIRSLEALLKERMAEVDRYRTMCNTLSLKIEYCKSMTDEELTKMITDPDYIETGI